MPAERGAAAQPGAVAREHTGADLRRLSRREEIIWLERGIAGDDTHGHVDDITRFVDQRTVADRV